MIESRAEAGMILQRFAVVVVEKVVLMESHREKQKYTIPIRMIFHREPAREAFETPSLPIIHLFHILPHGNHNGQATSYGVCSRRSCEREDCDSRSVGTFRVVVQQIDQFHNSIE